MTQHAFEQSMVCLLRALSGFAHDAELSVLFACQNGIDVMQALGLAELCLQCEQLFMFDLMRTEVPDTDFF